MNAYIFTCDNAPGNTTQIILMASAIDEAWRRLAFIMDQETGAVTNPDDLAEYWDMTFISTAAYMVRVGDGAAERRFF